MDEQKPELNINPAQQDAINKFKALPKGKGGRPKKEFGPLLKIAAAVLKDSGFTYKQIADELKTKPETVKKALAKDSDIQVNPEDVDKARKGYAAQLGEIIQKMMTSAKSSEYVARLAQTKNASLIIALATMIDKQNLLMGKPTDIVETRDLAKTIDDKLKELDEIEAALNKSIVITENPKNN